MGSPTVLCIDDRPQVLDLRKKTLESHGYDVKIASSGYAAMKILGENVRGRGSTGVQTGRHGRGSASLPYEATVSQSANHPAFSVLRDARANPVVGG
jgi:CheY-like chemotaxis protein